MIKPLIAFLLALLPSLAECWPGVSYPQGYEGTVKRTSLGWHVLWVYPKDGKLWKTGWSCKHGDCNPGAFTNAYAQGQIQGIDYIRAEAAKFPPLDCSVSGPNVELCSERKTLTDELLVKARVRFVDSITPPPAPTPIYIVTPAASNSPDGKKPVYTFTPPSTLKVNGLRVSPGTECGPFVYQATPRSGRYHQVTGGVAECQLKP